MLWVHGVVGGSDQAPGGVRTYLGDGFRVLAVSRFGYLGSPLPPDGSPTAQADRYAALLDARGIDRVAVVGFSAGTASSLRFALRHPARCSALVLWSQAVPPYRVPPAAVMHVLGAFYGSDLPFWSLMRYAPSLMMRLMGVPRPVQKRLSAPQRDQITRLMVELLPVSRRKAGILNDILATNPDLNGLSLAGLTVPSLMIHAKDDPWGAHDGARRMDDGAPHARFVEFDDGGHLLTGHTGQARALMSQFIRRTSAPAPGASAR